MGGSRGGGQGIRTPPWNCQIISFCHVEIFRQTPSGTLDPRMRLCFAYRICPRDLVFGDDFQTKTVHKHINEPHHEKINKVSMKLSTTRIVQFFNFVNPKFSACSCLLWLYIPFVSDLVGNHNPGISCRGLNTFLYFFRANRNRPREHRLSSSFVTPRKPFCCVPMLQPEV